MAGIVRIMLQQLPAKYLVFYEEPSWIKDKAVFDSLEEAKAYAEKLSKKYNGPIANMPSKVR